MSQKNPSDHYSVHTAQTLKWPSANLASLPVNRLELCRRFMVGPRVLDLGCGAGAYTMALSSLGFESVGVDCSADLVAEARDAYEGITFMEADAEHLPFEDDAFESAITFDVLEHVDDVAVLTELRRCCRHRLIICVPAVFDMAVGRYGLIYWHYQDPTHLRYYTEETAREALQKAGWRVIHVERDGEIELRQAFIMALRVPSLVRRAMGRILRVIPIRSFCQNLILVAETV